MKPPLKYIANPVTCTEYPVVTSRFFSFALRLADWYFPKYHNLLGHFLYATFHFC